jgi:hypothetical protein
MFGLYRKMTVDTVLAGFRKTVDDLRDIGARCTADIIKNEDEITVLTAKSREAGAERNRANTIADKLDALLS